MRSDRERLYGDIQCGNPIALCSRCYKNEPLSRWPVTNATDNTAQIKYRRMQGRLQNTSVAVVAAQSKPDSKAVSSRPSLSRAKRTMP